MYLGKFINWDAEVRQILTIVSITDLSFFLESNVREKQSFHCIVTRFFNNLLFHNC